ncbi:hypothetical protein Tsubulata_002872 [Turnera subulata]|uniref:Uncharacterized protein n=1 Tax=Turnera subulata TaxID=218843 RepID=A0A9Q0FCZ1_9ROSI|nr:hypothetical protein Tsubulata_002872 [Turnera subulata]
MMRFQRVIPDSVPLSNGKKPSTENGRPNSNGLNTASANFETKGFRFRSPSRNQDHHQSGSAASSPQHSDDNHNNQTQRQDNSSSPSPSNGGSGDRLLQWGQKKRARVSRSEIRALVDESSPSVKARQPLNKASRRVDGNKISSASMPPPPPPPPPLLQQSRGGNLIKKEGSALFPHSFEAEEFRKAFQCWKWVPIKKQWREQQGCF